MQTPKQQISTLHIWTETIKAIAKHYKEIIPFVSLFIVLPQTLFTIGFAKLSEPVVEKIKSITQIGLSSSPSLNYKELVTPASQFFSTYLFFGFLIVLSTLFAYIFLTINALSHGDLLSSSTHNFKNPYKAALKILIPKGFLIFVGVGILSFEQFLFGPFHVFSILALMGIILLIQSKNGVISSLWQALTLKFVSNAPGKGFATFVVILSTGILIYLYEAGVSFLTNNLLILDQWLKISRDYWEYKLPGFPCTIIFLITQLITIIAYSALLVFVVFFTSSLYGHVRKKLSERI